jgi:hypothetical protein
LAPCAPKAQTGQAANEEPRSWQQCQRPGTPSRFSLERREGEKGTIPDCKRLCQGGRGLGKGEEAKSASVRSSAPFPGSKDVPLPQDLQGLLLAQEGIGSVGPGAPQGGSYPGTRRWDK